MSYEVKTLQEIFGVEDGTGSTEEEILTLPERRARKYWARITEICQRAYDRRIAELDRRKEAA